MKETLKHLLLSAKFLVAVAGMLCVIGLVVVAGKSSLSKLVPGIFGALLGIFLGWHLAEHGESTAERAIGLAVLYVILFAGALMIVG